MRRGETAFRDSGPRVGDSALKSREKGEAVTTPGSVIGGGGIGSLGPSPWNATKYAIMETRPMTMTALPIHMGEVFGQASTSCQNNRF